jgi:hypothetical protein
VLYGEVNSGSMGPKRNQSRKRSKPATGKDQRRRRRERFMGAWWQNGGRSSGVVRWLQEASVPNDRQLSKGCKVPPKPGVDVLRRLW